jgi:membrane protein
MRGAAAARDVIRTLRAALRSPAAAFVRDLARRFSDAKVGLLGASLTFYAAFSLGPLLMLLGGWLSAALRGRPELAEAFRHALTDLVSQLMPLTDDADAVIQTSLDLILAQLADGAVGRMVFSFIVLLWASTAFFTSLQLALEMIFEVSEGRGFVRKRLVALLLVLAVAIFLVVEVIGAALGDAAGEAWRALQAWAAALDVPLPDVALPTAFSPLRFAATVLVFTICFRVLPRRTSDWVSAAIGGSFSAVALVVMRQVLMATVSIDRFNLVYGVVTGVVVVLLWLYLAMLGFLLGAVVAAESARWRRGGQHPAVPSDPG